MDIARFWSVMLTCPALGEARLFERKAEKGYRPKIRRHLQGEVKAPID
jgi:hypothetical protein